MEEIWVPVEGHEGRYEVSSLGNVKSINGHLGDIFLKFHDNGSGYKTVNLYTAPKKSRHAYVHRIVAEAFLENPCNLGEVNHKNGNKSDNRAANLEWVDRQSNISHAVNSGLFDTPKKIASGKSSKSVKCSNGETYRSIYQASIALGIARTNIRKACVGEISQTHGLTFSFI